jgi:hypothetical protein
MFLCWYLLFFFSKEICRNAICLKKPSRNRFLPKQIFITQMTLADKDIAEIIVA